ncbi:transcription factor kayak isoform X2 [Anopheles maculipalpis]|uniref:transcription factor kayak isoform X2 n=1 Tax=Anopheles maculipalpis TaxID=1496333 RepID=UPI0021599AB3|nr:transcription factor kayak isoform X2 [Anopheles maculipalpis]
MNVYDLCYDDKLKIPSSESVLLGSYGPLPTVVEDEFYDFPMQPEAKAAQTSTVPETLMEFDCVSGTMELMNHLTPPQTPPQTTSFGGVVGCVLPMQPSSLHAVTVPQQQQQEQFQPLYAPQPNVQSLLQQQQQQQASFQGANVTTTTDYYIMDEYSTMTSQQTGAGGNMQQQQQIAVTMEPLQQVPDDIATTSFNFDLNYTPQQLSEMAKIMRSLQLPLEVEENVSSYHDEESCGFSEVGSIENGGDSSSSSASSMVAHSPVYSDSAESSAYYYGSRGNDGDDEDWSPSKTKKLNARNGGAVMKKRPNGSAGNGRGIEEKKSRKKEQNKNAATRYRQKKKAEIEEILIEEEKLRERNEELKSRSQDLGREISCIKKLMREFCRNKGLL